MINLPQKVKDDELFEDGERIDGRRPEELRSLNMEVGILKNSDGSALVELGNTRILAAVYGPNELHPKHLQQPKKAVMKVRYNLAPFSVEDRKRPGPSRRGKEIGLVTRNALEPIVKLEEFPKAGIDVYIEVLEADASTRVTGITAASLALADAGIPMEGMVSACAVGKLKDTMVLDVAGDEDAYGKADIPVAFINGDEDITLLQFDGDITKQDLKEGLELAKEGGTQLYEKQKEVLQKRYDLSDDEVRGDLNA